MKVRYIQLLLLAGLVAFGGRPARAAPAEKPRPRQATPTAEKSRPRQATPTAKKPRVTFVVDVTPQDYKSVKRILKWLRKGLRRNQDLKYIPMQRLLEKPRGSMKRIRRAVKYMDQASMAIKGLEFGKAIQLLQKAVRKLEYSFLGLLRLRVKAQPLADALRLLATAYFLDGQAKLAKETIQRLLVIDPKTRYKAGRFPRQMAQLVDDERLMFDEFGTSTVVIKTEPPGARVYLNAHRVGRSPITIKGVRRGFNYLTARYPGYRTTTMGLEVDPPKLQRVTIKLRKFKRDPVPLLGGSYATMGPRVMSSAMQALAARLKVDILIVGRVLKDQDLGKVVLYAYDARLKELLRGPVKASISLDFPKPKSLEMIQMLFSGVRLDGTKPPPPKKPKTSFWKGFKERMVRFRRWRGFWPTVGSVAGILVTGLVVGLAVGLQPSSGLPPSLGSRHVIFAHPLKRF